MEEIDEGVAKLNLEAARIKKSRLIQRATTSTFPLSLGVATLFPGVTSATIVGFVGAYKIIELLREHIEIKKSDISMRKSEFFIPFVLRSNDRS
ncbi:hypothetical protein OHS18_13310 [Amycolatopsis sp. NBC_00355]|uniref:hypothetical protein n=1 Tax=Amycolatopsis sp. NBC_00355 TaxID=2975957 RepID=UPI002E26E6A4